MAASSACTGAVTPLETVNLAQCLGVLQLAVPGDLLDDDFEGGPLESEGESDSDAELVAPAGLPGAAPAQPAGKQQQRKKKKQKRSVVRF